ncbi:MAG TPA: LuxR C-terminal-related transcriptional regulator [Bacteroidales bacterium]|nr:LuxR C-terminal-related transcriptional regulator [Bacteroidales bacterium]
MVYKEYINDDFQKFCEQLEFDIHLNNYKNILMDEEKLKNIIVLPNQFFYINDFTTGKNIFVHPNIEKITGYTAEEFNDFGRIYELIHPDDSEFVYEFSKRSISVCKYYKQELLKNPFASLFTIDFRLKHQNGNYIKLNRHTTCLKTDNEGNMVLALVFFTDISHKKWNNSFNINWIGDTRYMFHFDDLIKKYSKTYSITNREKEILNLLINGLSATEIAKKLFLSVHTVISHRKNLLHKTKTKNTAELVKLAIERDFF